MTKIVTTVKQFKFRLKALASFVIFLFVLISSVSSLAVTHLTEDEELNRGSEQFYFDLNENGQPGKYRIQGMRYGNPQGEPWLLCHGFLQTGHSMLEYAKELVAQGKNVFVINEVGFGLDGERSVMRPGVEYQVGDYGMKGVVEGVAQSVANVSRLTGKKVTLLGFSMGAMASREYIEGTYAENEDGSPVRSEKLAIARQKLLKHTILIAGPPDTLTGMSTLLKLASIFSYYTLKTAAKKFNGFLPMGLGGPADNLESTSPVIKSVSVLKALGLFSVVRTTFKDGGNLRNYGSKEEIFPTILRRDFSSPHSDIVNSMMRKSIENDEHPPIVGSRTNMMLTQVGGELDGFVSVGAHLNEMQNYYSSNPKMTRGILGANMGHLDLTGEVFVHEQGLIQRLILRTDQPKKYDQLYEPYEVIGKMGFFLKKTIQKFKNNLQQPSSPKLLMCRALF